MTDLKAFGKTLQHLRKSMGLTQGALAARLNVSTDLISKWERAYQRKGRIWKPDRPLTMRLVEIFSDYLSPEDAQAWVEMAGYKIGRNRLQFFFPLDFPRVVQRAFDTVRPDVLVLMETEIWPNFVYSLAKRNVPLVLSNGRLSEKSFSRYKINPLEAGQ